MELLLRVISGYLMGFWGLLIFLEPCYRLAENPRRHFNLVHQANAVPLRVVPSSRFATGSLIMNSMGILMILGLRLSGSPFGEDRILASGRLWSPNMVGLRLLDGIRPYLPPCLAWSITEAPWSYDYRRRQPETPVMLASSWGIYLVSPESVLLA
ncbi:hypothetical protein NMY22_g16584 [Coprinellus aureogranulatus]|nr:hypothetical protein NMY22_g16584 [Coprinellus aureogranulatus]